MREDDLQQLMCDHRFHHDAREQGYVCRCGVIITDRTLTNLPKDQFRALTTWMAYHADEGPAGTEDD